MSTDPLFGHPSPSSAPAAPDRRILIVDDEPGPRTALAIALSDRYQVVEASGGREAVSIAAMQPFDLVLLDICMPDWDGFTTLAKLREADPPLTVLMLTGVDGSAHIRESMRIGARYFIPKAQPLPVLFEAIDSFINETPVKRGEARLAAETRRIAMQQREELKANRPKLWQNDATSCFMHDLSSPLLMIQICLQVLHREINDATQTDPTLARLERTLEHMGKATDYCRQLTTNWRTLHRHTEGFVATDLRQIAATAAEVALLPSTRISFTGAASANVHGSPLDLTRLFQNLITNACQAGARHLTLDIAALADPKRIRVTMTDDGEGMSAERLAALDGPPERSESADNGLGVLIIRQIATAHGASLAYTSTPGVGSRVTLEFPVA